VVEAQRSFHVRVALFAVSKIVRSVPFPYLIDATMNVRRTGSVCAVALGVLTCPAQEGLLHGRAVDAASGRALPGAHATVPGKPLVAVADSGGRFTLPWDRRAPITVRVSHTGFVRQERRLRPSEQRDGVAFDFALMRDTVSLREAVVRAPMPEVVYERPDLHVGAYLVNRDGLWVLMYERMRLLHRQEEAGRQVLLGARLHLLDTLFRERATIILPGAACALHRDHGGRPVVEGLAGAWLATFNGEHIVLSALGLETLRKAVLPWTDSLPGHLIGNNRSAVWPAFDHFAHEVAADRTRLLCSVEDRHTMGLFRSQYKYMSGRDKVIAMDLERELGIDREVIAGYLTGFHHHPYFRVPYAPLFVVDGAPVVFDHAAGSIRRFTPSFAPDGEGSMAHHRLHGYRGHMLQDAATGVVYAVFHRAPRTWLRAIDPFSGEAGPPFRITHPFPEEVQVHGGHAYYLYRPFGSLRQRALHRERIR
jgi:hypothetical protein